MADDVKVKITLDQLLNAELALQRLAALPVPVRTAYHIARLLKTVKVETDQFRVQRNALIKELGAERAVTRAEKLQGLVGTVTVVKPKNEAMFKEKIASLTSMTITMDKWLIDIELLEGIKLSASDIASLGPLVIDF